MPLIAPELDKQSATALFEAARRRIPLYAPEWTDYNESDPGITLLQLFAWLTESMLFQMNQVPERNYIKFLQLMNLELRPAQPAVAHLTFEPDTGAAANGISVPRRTRIGAQPPDGGDQLIFETDDGFDVIPLPLAEVQVYDGAGFTRVTDLNKPDAPSYRPFGWTPQVNSMLYLGFTPPRQRLSRMFPQQMRLRVFRPLAAAVDDVLSIDEALVPPAPPVQLVWEYRPLNSQRWRQLSLFADESVAFTREGYIVVQGPEEAAPSREGKIQDQDLIWLRCRLASDAYPAGRAPEIAFIRPNVVSARNLSTVRDEIVGISDGEPRQRFDLRRKPVFRDTLQLYAQTPGETPEQWKLVDDFLASKREDKHFTLNATTGEIVFGDGERGQIPLAGAEITALEYRYGGSGRGNVAAGLINTALATLNGVASVINERKAEGGRDEQTVDALKEEAPSFLRSRNRAVTEEDFKVLAERAGGVARAKAVALMHPQHQGVDVPGAITIIIVPDTEDVPPVPSPDLIRQVCLYLNQFRLLTAEVYVKAPEYIPITVTAKVFAAPYAAPDEVKRAVIKELNAYLNPKKRGFGEDLYRTKLYDVILNVKDVEAVRFLELHVNRRLNESEVVTLRADELIYGIDHDIVVEPYRDI